MRLPSSLTEPISIGTFFEISGAASKKDRMVMTRPSTVGPQTDARSGCARRPGSAHRAAARVHLGRDGIADLIQLGPFHLSAVRRCP